jgi:hypothetical protein
VPLCWRHHQAFDTGRLDLLPYLEPRWRAEVANAVAHLGLVGALRRLTGRFASDVAAEDDDGPRLTPVDAMR